jgi:hypothetical protein
LPLFCAAVHDVGFGEIGGSDFVGGFEFAEGEGKAFANAVVVDREDVGATETEDEEHLDGPFSDASYLCKVRHDGFVGHAANLGECGDGAVEGFGGKVAEGEAFVVGEAGGAKLLVRAVEEVLGGEVLVAGDGVEAFEQAAVDGGGGFAVELLIDDALDEGLKRRLRAGDAHGEGASAFDETPKFGISSSEFTTGESGVVARRTWAVARARHMFDGIAGAEESLASGREFGLDWFAFTRAIPFGQGRCSGDLGCLEQVARDVVQVVSAWVR